jgi:hypothetical protein
VGAIKLATRSITLRAGRSQERFNLKNWHSPPPPLPPRAPFIAYKTPLFILQMYVDIFYDYILKYELNANEKENKTHALATHNKVA